MNKKRAGSVFVVIGAVLMLSALLLFIYNTIEAKLAGNASQEALSTIHEMIEKPEISVEKNDTISSDEVSETTAPTEVSAVTEPEKLEVVMVEWYDYIGYLSIPAFDLELPVQATISEDRLYKSPCLEFGTPMTNDAVIAGHNYKYHFLPLHNISVGEKLFFTYMNGFTVSYEVVKSLIIAPTDIAAVEQSDHDLVLYTCTSGGASRVAVFCDRTIH